MSKKTEQEKQELLKKINETRKTTQEKVDELKVITIGATDEEAYYIGQIFAFINRENLDKLNGELSRFNGAIDTIEKPLNLYKKALLLIDKKHLNHETYKELENEIKKLEKDLKEYTAIKNVYESAYTNTKKQVGEMWEHIDIVVDEEKKTSTWTYDMKYWKPILNLAMLTLPLNKYVPPQEKDVNDTNDKGLKN